MSMEALQERIGYRFNDPALLERALTHSSYANESRQKIECNERMEFLGDAVLSIIVADHIFHKFHLAEGDLTKIRASLVCEKSLFEFAQKIKLGQELLLGHGEEHTNGRKRPSILADAFEALLAAIYLDGGIEPVKEFLLPRITAEINGIIKAGNDRDYKTSLQQVVQKEHGDILEYVTVGERGPAHMKVFTVEARLNGNVIGTGNGRSKRAAEQNAAREALALFGL